MPRSLPTSVTQVLQQRRWTAIEARIVLDSISRSGLTIAQFARAHDVDYQRLNAWRRRLTSTTATTSPSAPPIQFVELSPPALTPAPVAPRYEIVLPGGEILRVEGSVDPVAVAALLGAMRGARGC